MNKKGFTLIETLGAIVILGVTLTLLTFIIASFISANERISISTLANQEGNLIVRRIQEDLRELNPTTYETCPGTICYVFQQEFSYEFNEVSEEIELIVHDIPLTYKLQIVSGNLNINDDTYEFENFIFDSSSSLNVTEETGEIFVNFNIVIESEKNDLFEFLMSYSFESLVIPDA
ncbi:type II secretion system protein [Mycoplasmatota bacterium WC30]